MSKQQEEQKAIPLDKLTPQNCCRSKSNQKRKSNSSLNRYPNSELLILNMKRAKSSQKNQIKPLKIMIFQYQLLPHSMYQVQL